jgi:serine/threonine-protein kinase
MCALNHPNVVKVLNFGVDGGDCFIAMDYLEGTNLAEYVRENGQMPWEEAVSVIVDCAKGLSHAHANGIVHRDIKPSNIMLLPRDGRRVVQIVDFGLAKGFDEDASTAQKLTQTDHVMGTPYYMSPEQCSREILDNRSDIYSLGCVLYELLAGKVPFDGDSMFAIMYGHLHDDVPPLPAQVPAWLQSVVRSMMARERSLRLQTMDEVADALLTKNAPVSLEVTGKKRKERSARLPAAALVGLVTIFSMVLGGMWWFSHAQSRHSTSNESVESTEAASDQNVDAVQKLLDAADVERTRWHELNRNVTAISGAYEKDGEHAIKLYTMAAELARKNGQLERATKILFDGGMKMGLSGIDMCVRSIDNTIQDSDVASGDPKRAAIAEDILREGNKRFDLLNVKFEGQYDDHDRLQIALYKRLSARENNPAEKERQIKLWMESARRSPNATLDLVGSLAAAAKLPGTSSRQVQQYMDEAHSLLIRFHPVKDNCERFATLSHQIALESFLANWSRSVKLCEYSVSEITKIHGADSLDALPGNLVLASLYLNHGEAKKADKIYLRLVPLLELQEARTTAGVFQEWRMQVALALAAQKHFAESERLLEMAEAVIDRLPPESPLRIQLLRSKACYYCAVERPGKQGLMLMRARKLALRYNIASVETAAINHDLSVILQRQGELRQALEAEFTAEQHLQFCRGRDDVTVGHYRARRQALEQTVAKQNAN